MTAVLKILAGFNIYSIGFRILLATLIGGCIGSERGRHGRAAGLRTHILVCLGSTMTVMVGIYSAMELELGGDPMRVSAQVVSGIGFLGAGTILTRNQAQVTGLTTAAGLWTTACIGLAIGAGFYWGAALAAIAMMATITIFTKLERFTKRQAANTYYLEFDDVTQIGSFLKQFRSETSSLQIVPAKSGITSHIGIELCIDNSKDADSIIERFSTENHIVIAIPNL